jgi:MFS family permease
MPPLPARFALHTRPLLDGQYRLLFAAQIVTTFGSMLSVVALPYQTNVIAHSSLAVGLIGAVELVPVLALPFVGGALADAQDRRRIAAIAELAFSLATIGLVVNAATRPPKLWPLYVVAAVTAGLDALQRPALDALVPRLVAREQLPAAAALSSLRWTIFAVAGPAIAGVVIAAFGFAAVYAIDAGTFVVSFGLLSLLRPVPPTDAQPASLARSLEGLRYVEAGAVAGAFGARVSVISGGVLCVVGVALAAAALPQLWRYERDAATADTPATRGST